MLLCRSFSKLKFASWLSTTTVNFSYNNESKSIKLKCSTRWEIEPVRAQLNWKRESERNLSACTLIANALVIYEPATRLYMVRRRFFFVSTIFPCIGADLYSTGIFQPRELLPCVYVRSALERSEWATTAEPIKSAARTKNRGATREYKNSSRPCLSFAAATDSAESERDECGFFAQRRHRPSFINLQPDIRAPNVQQRRVDLCMRSAAAVLVCQKEIWPRLSWNICIAAPAKGRILIFSTSTL